MIYNLNIPEIHCKGCESLITLSFEDYFRNINVDIEKKQVSFESELSTGEVNKIIEDIFAEFKKNNLDYTFNNLIQL